MRHHFRCANQQKELQIRKKIRIVYFSVIVVMVFSATMVFCFSRRAFAHELYQVHRDAREEGMGGAYISVVNDAESLWFNPAGIARDTGTYWTIATIRAGASDPSELQDLQNLQSQSSFNSTLQKLYGKPMWADVGEKSPYADADSAFIMPGLAFSYFMDGDSSILIDNPVDPTLDLNYIEDKGFALGTGFSFGNVLQFGVAGKYIMRTGVRQAFGADTIANILNGGSTSTIFNSLNNTGTGISLDAGANLILPGQMHPVLSFVWKNIGNTDFKPDTGSAAAPPSDPAELEAGGALRFDLPGMTILLAFEVDYMNDSTVQLGQKLHAGVELSLPLIALRAGLDQGYFSYGCGFNLGIIRIDAASWGEEMGGAQGQMESQRYLVEVSLRMGFSGAHSGSADDSSDSGNWESYFDTGGDGRFVRR